jgi:hypothetical protein
VSGSAAAACARSPRPACSRLRSRAPTAAATSRMPLILAHDALTPSPTQVPFGAPAPHFPLPLSHTRPHLRCHRRSRRAACAAAPSPVTWCPAASGLHRRPPRSLRGAIVEVSTSTFLMHACHPWPNSLCSPSSSTRPDAHCAQPDVAPTSFPAAWARLSLPCPCASACRPRSPSSSPALPC